MPLAAAFHTLLRLFHFSTRRRLIFAMRFDIFADAITITAYDAFHIFADIFSSLI